MGLSTASMTCAGLLALAVYEGEMSEKSGESGPRAKPKRDINKDSQIRRGLAALSTTIGKPVGENAGRQAAGGKANGRSARPAAMIPKVGGRTYYFLWSLERVAVALDLKTIGKKDWYEWARKSSWKINYQTAAGRANTAIAGRTRASRFCFSNAPISFPI